MDDTPKTITNCKEENAVMLVNDDLNSIEETSFLMPLPGVTKHK